MALSRLILIFILATNISLAIGSSRLPHNATAAVPVEDSHELDSASTIAHISHYLADAVCAVI